MSDFTLKKRYEAMLLRLKSQQVELLVQITGMLEDPESDLADIQELVEDYTQIEGAFMTFKQTVGDYIQSKEPPPPVQVQPPPPAPEAPKEAPPDPGSSKVVTPEMSPTLKRSTSVKRTKTRRKKKEDTTENNEEGAE
jgi:hypothetical protein